MSEPPVCDHFIDLDDPWAGTYCKLLKGHAGEHSAHYAKGDKVSSERSATSKREAR